MSLFSSLPKTGEALVALNHDLEQLSLPDFLRWSLDVFDQRVAHITSFGPTGMVILDQLMRIRPDIYVATIDTEFLFTETYALWDEVEQRYGIRVQAARAALAPVDQERLLGPALWSLEPDVCCHERKVKPLAAALAGFEAWYTGVRRDQSTSRATTPLVSWDLRNNLFKLSPLAAWTREQVWTYLRSHSVPYNRLHDQGYTSIGCTHCTRVPVSADQERSGRWAGRVKNECGLHAPVRSQDCVA